MTVSLDPLPGDLTACHAMIRQLLTQLGQSHRQINHMEHQLQQLLRRLYGRSSKTLDPNQRVLFIELLEELKTQAPPPRSPPPSLQSPSIGTVRVMGVENSRSTCRGNLIFQHWSGMIFWTSENPRSTKLPQKLPQTKILGWTGKC